MSDELWDGVLLGVISPECAAVCRFILYYCLFIHKLILKVGLMSANDIYVSCFTVTCSSLYAVSRMFVACIDGRSKRRRDGTGLRLPLGGAATHCNVVICSNFNISGGISKS